MTDRKLKILYENTEKLKPYKHNAKIHTPEQIEQIVKSIDWPHYEDHPWDIYAIINNVNNKVYIGQTRQTIKKRFIQHMTPTDGSPLLQKAVAKYGKENFSVIKLDTAKTQEEANLKEKQWIRWSNSANREHGYNLSFGGEIGSFNDEVRRKMSIDRTGEGNNFYGKHHTAEAKKRMSEAKKGKATHSQRVLCVETGDIYDSIKHAAEATNTNRQKISLVCLHRYGRNTAGGYHWEYVE